MNISEELENLLQVCCNTSFKTKTRLAIIEYILDKILANLGNNEEKNPYMCGEIYTGEGDCAEETPEYKQYIVTLSLDKQSSEPVARPTFYVLVSSNRCTSIEEMASIIETKFFNYLSLKPGPALHKFDAMVNLFPYDGEELEKMSKFGIRMACPQLDYKIEGIFKFFDFGRFLDGEGPSYHVYEQIGS